jgi:hypothetical protein
MQSLPSADVEAIRRRLNCGQKPEGDQSGGFRGRQGLVKALAPK